MSSPSIQPAHRTTSSRPSALSCREERYVQQDAAHTNATKMTTATRRDGRFMNMQHDFAVGPHRGMPGGRLWRITARWRPCETGRDFVRSLESSFLQEGDALQLLTTARRPSVPAPNPKRNGY